MYQSVSTTITEAERLSVLHSYDVLDTACEASFDNIVSLAAQITGSPISLVSLIDRDRQWFKAHHGLDATETPREQAFCSHAIANPHQPMVVADATRDPRFAANPLVTQPPDIRFYAGVPLISPEGAALGTLCVIDRRPRDISAEQLDMLVRLADTVVTTLELRRAMLRLRDMAMIDPLTGLPNRRAAQDAIARAIARQCRHNEPFSLLYFDLDGFKTINDQLGHIGGDRVLREVAKVLTDNLRGYDIAARIGGDEFAVLLTDGNFHTAAIAERIRHAVEIAMAARGWMVTASVGGVLFNVAPDNIESALAAADAMMYGAKAAGRNRVHWRAIEFGTAA